MIDEMLNVDPSDSRHMFWEEMKRLFFAMREIKPGDLDDEMMEDFLKAIDEVSNVLQRIERKGKERRAGRKHEEGDLTARIFNKSGFHEP